MTEPRHDIWADYVDDVLSGTQTVGKYVRLEVEKFISDLDRQGTEDFTWVFDSELAEKYIRFIQVYGRHTRGKWAGEPFILSPWQGYFIAQIFGWVHMDDKDARRYRTAYVYVARKSGKSQLAAGIAMAMAALDKDGAPEYVFAATTRQQARIVFDEVSRSIRKAPEKARRLFDVRRHDIFTPRDGTMKPVSSDAHTLDGLSLNLGVVDEFHAHKTSELLDVLKSSMGSRKSPLLLAITTAGFLPEGPCANAMQMGKDVLDGIKEDERTLNMIYQVDKGDEMDDDSIWVKANPGLGASIYKPYLKSQLTQAKNLGPQAVDEFKTKHLNLFVQSSDSWLDIEKWDSLARPELASLITKQTPCHVGVDLASTADITSLALCFELEDCTYTEVHHFVPSEAITRGLAADKGSIYGKMIDSEFVHIAEDSNVTDYNAIRKFISGRHIDANGRLAESEDSLMHRYNVSGVYFDPWNATQIMTDLEHYDGVPCIAVRQGSVTMNPIVNELEARFLEENFHHNGDPVLSWMAGNIVLEINGSGHRRPSKKKSGDKIDGMMATLNALGGLMAAQIPEEDDSIPESWVPRWT